MIGISVADVAAFGKWRDHDQGNTRTVAEEVDGLNVARIIVTTPFIEGDDNVVSISSGFAFK